MSAALLAAREGPGEDDDVLDLDPDDLDTVGEAGGPDSDELPEDEDPGGA